MKIGLYPPLKQKYIDYQWNPIIGFSYVAKASKKEVKNLDTYYKLLGSLEANNCDKLDPKRITDIIDHAYTSFKRKVSHRLVKMIIKIKSLVIKRYKFDYNLTLVEERYIALKIKLISKAIEGGELEICQYHINNLAIDAFVIFDWAQEKGHTQILELLLERHDINFRSRSEQYINDLIMWAIRQRHIKIAKLLLKNSYFDPSFNGYSMIKWAVTNGYKEVIQLLLSDSRVNLADNDNAIYRLAIENNHKDIAELIRSHTQAKK